MRPFLSIFFAIALSIAFADSLHAETVGRAKLGACNTYGADAAAQSKRAEGMNCGFSGARFMTKPEGHANWCKSAKDESVSSERTERNKLVNKCAICRDYANKASSAVQLAKAFRCNFTGQVWTKGDGTADDPHFVFCMHVPWETNTNSGPLGLSRGITTTHAQTINHETDIRDTALNTCKAAVAEKFTPEERKTCYDYRDKAINAQNFNNKNKCGATMQGRWTGTSNEHFLACIMNVSTEAGRAFIAKEEEIREYGAHACAEKGWKLAADGKPIRPMGRPPKPKVAADTKTIERQMTPRPAGGSDKSQDNTGTNKPAGTSSGGSGAMERLGGGPSGGYDNSRDSRTPGSKSKPTPAGAAIITPAATATQPAAPPASKTKSFGRNSGSQDYGIFHPTPPPAPKPLYVR